MRERGDTEKFDFTPEKEVTLEPTQVLAIGFRPVSKKLYVK